MKRLFYLFVALLNLCILLACFWDKDTIEMERQQFPSVIELISGKFIRHSPEFHYWRINDRLRKIDEYPDSLELFDDLAVSYSKTGDNKEAIKRMLEKETKSPGLYETYANLGTFYLHDGQFEKGVTYIEKAISINPDAHFGREKYQLQLARYVISTMKDGKLLFPMNNDDKRSRDVPPMQVNTGNFYTFLYRDLTGDTIGHYRSKGIPKEELEKAVIGLLGMMKFGTHDSPVLLEALVDLLMGTGMGDGARHLAARAYLKASYSFSDTTIRNIYRKKAAFTVFLQYNEEGKQFNLSDLEKLLKDEIQEGDDFYAQVRNNEMDWIKKGKNPEKEFETMYYQDPATSKRVQKRYDNSLRDYQVGNGNRKSLELIDYRAMLTKNTTVDGSFKTTVDSLFSRVLVQEIRAEKEDSIISDSLNAQNPENDISKFLPKFPKYGLFVLIIVAALLLILRKRKKKR